MTTTIQRSISEPVRDGLTFEERWRGPDAGSIFCWERGRELRKESPELARSAEDGELVMLWWKGGVEKKLEGNVTKQGTLRYLATWQGLRREDLKIDLNGEYVLTCTRTGQQVIFRRTMLPKDGD